MNLEILNTITEKLLKPKYPWIEKFEWVIWDGEEGRVNYRLEIKAAASIWKKGILEIIQYETKVEEDMKSLFKMLSPEPNEKFGSVSINFLKTNFILF